MCRTDFWLQSLSYSPNCWPSLDLLFQKQVLFTKADGIFFFFFSFPGKNLYSILKDLLSFPFYFLSNYTCAAAFTIKKSFWTIKTREKPVCVDRMQIKVVFGFFLRYKIITWQFAQCLIQCMKALPWDTIRKQTMTRVSHYRLNLLNIQEVLLMIARTEDDGVWFIHIMTSILLDLYCVINGFSKVWFLISSKGKICQPVTQFPQAKFLWFVAVNFHWCHWAGFWEPGSSTGWY